MCASSIVISSSSSSSSSTTVEGFSNCPFFSRSLLKQASSPYRSLSKSTNSSSIGALPSAKNRNLFSIDGFIFSSFLQARQVWARNFTLAFFSRSVGTFVFSLTLSASALFLAVSSPSSASFIFAMASSTAAFFSASMVLTSSAVSVALGWSGSDCALSNFFLHLSTMTCASPTGSSGFLTMLPSGISTPSNIQHKTKTL
mmetsp:Transcript_15126/g.44514  ORF Transcript_15126/g.44514 Transcript_15126/m.44514 type:complete len:200 (-) Transcript_15126:4383-4982(-)